MDDRRELPEGSEAKGAGEPEPVQETGVPRPRRRVIVLAAVSAAVVAILAGGVVVGYRSWWRRDAFAEVAARAKPEVGALILEARDAVTRLLEQFPDSPEALNVLARLHSRFGEAEEALRLWERCLELDAEFGPAYHSIASAALQSGEHGKAADYFRKAIRQNPTSPVMPAELAEMLINLGKLEEAVSVLEENLKRHPSSMSSLALLGQAYVQLKEYGKARKCLEAVIEIAPEYTNAYYGLVTACARLGDPEKSKEYLEKFRELKAKDEEGHRTSLKVMDDTAQVRRSVAQAYAAVGGVYLSHGDPQTAERCLVRATELAADHVQSREVLAWLYHRQGRWDQALKTLMELSDRAPDDVGAQMSAGALYAQLQLFPRAERAFTRAIELTPRQAGPYAALTNLYLRSRRKFAESKVLALKAAALEPVAGNFFLLAEACQANGDLAGALSALEEAIALDPENAEYQRARTLLQERVR